MSPGRFCHRADQNLLQKHSVPPCHCGRRGHGWSFQCHVHPLEPRSLPSTYLCHGHFCSLSILPASITSRLSNRGDCHSPAGLTACECRAPRGTTSEVFSPRGLSVAAVLPGLCCRSCRVQKFFLTCSHNKVLDYLFFRYGKLVLEKALSRFMHKHLYIFCCSHLLLPYIHVDLYS